MIINVNNIPKKYRTCCNCKYYTQQWDYDDYESYCNKYHFHTEDDNNCDKWEFNGYQICCDGCVLWNKYNQVSMRCKYES